MYRAGSYQCLHQLWPNIAAHLAPHPYAHGLGTNRRAHPEPLLLTHELVEQEGLARVELAHHGHHCHCGVDVVQVFDIATDDLQVAVVVGVRVDQLHWLLRQQL